MQPCPFSVSSAAHLLSRCVSRGALPQEEIDSASSRLTSSFSAHLHEAEHQTRIQRQLDQLLLQRELLKAEKEVADVTHTFYLMRRFQVLQVLWAHLQAVLQQACSVRQRLMKPLCTTNLPVPAHLHRPVVELLEMLVDFTEAAEEKILSLRRRPEAADHLTHLSLSVPRLMSQVAEVQSVSTQLLHWKDESA